MNFDQLPEDLIKVTLLKQDLKTIKEYCKTSTKAKKICQDDFFWQQLVERDFSNHPKKIGTTWYNTYKLLNTTIYEVLYIYQYGSHPVDVESEMFWDLDQAIKYVVERIVGSYYEFECMRNIVTNDLSSKFQSFLQDDRALDELETEANNDPEITNDYNRYIERYKTLIKAILIKTGQIKQDDLTFKIVKKKINC